MDQVLFGAVAATAQGELEAEVAALQERLADSELAAEVLRNERETLARSAECLREELDGAWERISELEAQLDDMCAQMPTGPSRPGPTAAAASSPLEGGAAFESLRQDRDYWRQRALEAEAMLEGGRNRAALMSFGLAGQGLSPLVTPGPDTAPLPANERPLVSFPLPPSSSCSGPGQRGEDGPELSLTPMQQQQQRRPPLVTPSPAGAPGSCSPSPSSSLSFTPKAGKALAAAADVTTPASQILPLAFSGEEASILTGSSGGSRPIGTGHLPSVVFPASGAATSATSSASATASAPFTGVGSNGGSIASESPGGLPRSSLDASSAFGPGQDNRARAREERRRRPRQGLPAARLLLPMVGLAAAVGLHLLGTTPDKVKRRA